MWECIEYMVTHSLCQPVTAIRLERKGKGSCLTWDTSFLDGRHQSLGEMKSLLDVKEVVGDRDRPSPIHDCEM